jgi:hypothetical protein
MGEFTRFFLLLGCLAEAGVPVPTTTEIVETNNPAMAKELARAKFEAQHADVRELSRAKHAAARGDADGRFREFLAGRGTLDLVLGALQRQRQAELALAVRDADRVAAVERYWKLVWTIDVINGARYEAGRIAITDFLQARYARLEATLALLQTAAPRGGQADGNSTALPVEDGPAASLLAKELARSKFEMLRADPVGPASRGLGVPQPSGRVLGDVDRLGKGLGQD